jgi:ABC-type tungstate transport system substrate-binding protein
MCLSSPLNRFRGREGLIVLLNARMPLVVAGLAVYLLLFRAAGLPGTAIRAYADGQNAINGE